MEASLISTDKLKKRGYIHSNVEDSLLRTLIIRVQDTIVEPVIGTTLFKRLLAGIDADDLTSDEILLMDNYVIPLMVAGCDYRSVSVVTYQIRNKTAGLTRDEHISPVSLAESASFEEKLNVDVTTYRNRLIGYLKDNYALFPDYNVYECNYENLNPLSNPATSNISFL